MLAWLLPALAALGCWGVWSFLPTIAKSYLNTKTFILFNVIGSALASIFVFFRYKTSLSLNLKGATFATITGLAGVFGTYFFVIALKAVTKQQGKEGVIIMLTALYPLIALLLSAIFLKQNLNYRQMVGMGLALVAVVLMAK